MTKQELELCINEHGKAIYSFCRQLACNQQEAEDLYQDTFLLAVELSEKIDYEKNPKSYLLSVALRIWKNRKRKFAWRKKIADMHSMVEEKTVENSESAEKPIDEQIIDREKKEAVRQAVNMLPERLKVTVLLFYMEELSTTEISAITKIPKGTVLSRLHQARKLLRKELENVLDGERME